MKAKTLRKVFTLLLALLVVLNYATFVFADDTEGTGTDGSSDTTQADDASDGTSDNGDGTTDTASNDTTSADTASNDTASDDTAAGDTASDDTAGSDTTSDDTASDDAAADNTAADDSAADDTASDDTTADDTAADDTAADDTAADDTAADDTAADDAAADDTTADDSAAEETTDSAADDNASDNTSEDTIREYTEKVINLISYSPTKSDKNISKIEEIILKLKVITNKVIYKNGTRTSTEKIGEEDKEITVPIDEITLDANNKNIAKASVYVSSFKGTTSTDNDGYTPTEFAKKIMEIGGQYDVLQFSTVDGVVFEYYSKYRTFTDGAEGWEWYVGKYDNGEVKLYSSRDGDTMPDNVKNWKILSDEDMRYASLFTFDIELTDQAAAESQAILEGRDPNSIYASIPDTSVPKTGDESNIAGFALILMISALGMVVATRAKKSN